MKMDRVHLSFLMGSLSHLAEQEDDIGLSLTG